VGKARIKSYYLLGYGTDGYIGQDVDEDGIDDHVVILLSNGVEPMMYIGGGRPDGPDPSPPLVDCLNYLKDNPGATSVAGTELMEYLW
jgi:hypothetical protein